MILLDFEIGGDRPLVPIARPRAVEVVAIQRKKSKKKKTGSAGGPGRALGALNARWYAAMWRFGEVLKKLLDFDNGNELPPCMGGSSLIEWQAQGQPLRFRVRQPRGNAGS